MTDSISHWCVVCMHCSAVITECPCPSSDRKQQIHGVCIPCKELIERAKTIPPPAGPKSLSDFWFWLAALFAAGSVVWLVAEIVLYL